MMSNFDALSQACRIGGQAIETRYTAFSMILGNGVYRVRRWRFADVRLAPTSGGSTIRGPNNGVSITCLVSIAALFPRVELSSVAAMLSRMVDVEVELVDVELVSSSIVSKFCSCICTTTAGVSHLFMHSGISNHVLRPLTCNDLFMMDLIFFNTEEGEPTTFGEQSSTTMLDICGYNKPL